MRVDHHEGRVLREQGVFRQLIQPIEIEPDKHQPDETGVARQDGICKVERRFRDGASGILTWAEITNGNISRPSLELLTPARNLASQLGARLGQDNAGGVVTGLDAGGNVLARGKRGQEAANKGCARATRMRDDVGRQERKSVRT